MGAHVIYVATASLVSGHTEGTAYALDLRLTEKDRTSKVESTTRVALSGRQQTTLTRREVLWRCETGIVVGASGVAALREFLDSVMDGQSFTFNPSAFYGTSPTAQARTVVLQSRQYTERRAVRRGAGGNGDGFQFSFELREVPS